MKKYKSEKEEAQNKSKKSKVEYETSCLVVDPHPPMLVDYFPCIQGVEQYHISLTKVVGILWMQKWLGFSMHVACHSMFFSHSIGMRWYKPSTIPLKDKRA
jgi:hypothetical protein